MASDKGELTKEQKQQFLDWLKKRWTGDANCFVCRKSQWVTGDHFITPTAQTPGGGLVLGGISYPQVFVNCGNCGHTIYFNAMLIGLISQDVKEEEKKEASGGGDG